MKAHIWLAGLCVLGLVGGGCSKTTSLFKPSVEDQKKLGEQAAADLAKKEKFVQGDQLARVQRVGNRLVKALNDEDRKTWDFRFHVVESKEINAFAIPGGNTYFYTALLDRIKTDDELAAVMAHEMTHVRAQHWAGQVAADQQRSAGLSVLLAAVRANDEWYSAASVANTLVDLRYSRKDEDEADAGGLYNMVDAGYKPQGMLDLFATLKKAAGSGSSLEFMNSHPLTDKRIQKTQERIAALKKK